MRTLASVSCVALAACNFHAADPYTAPDGQQGSEMEVPMPDGDTMPMPDGPQLCFGAGLGRVCLTAPPSQARTLDGTIDTGNAASCDEVLEVGGTISCVIAGTTVTIETAGRLRAIGPRPLVIVSAGQFQIEGEINVASVRMGGNNIGAGAGQPSAACGPPRPGENDSGGGGGGAGGSFAGQGGDGGNGDANNSDPPAGSGDGGDATDEFVPTKLRAGCPGANGGNGGNPADIGTGGAGGGAVYLISGTRIELSGAVIASGAGGGGADEQSGGGGGSGGMIGLDAPTVAVSGRVAANGGGGGEGGGLFAPRAVSGADGTIDDARAAGGIAPTGDGGGSDGGNGGQGSGGGMRNGGNGIGDNGGGGGGGGGAGYIYVKGTLQSSGVISPAAAVTP